MATNPNDLSLGRRLGIQFRETPGRVMDSARSSAENAARLYQDTNRNISGFGTDFMSGLIDGQQAPQQMPNPFSDPHGAMTAMATPPTVAPDPVRSQMAMARQPMAPKPGSIEWVNQQMQAEKSEDPMDGFRSLMGSAQRRPDPVADFAGQSAPPAPRVPSGPPPIRVQRDGTGRITSASNIDGAQGDVFPSSGGRGTFNQPSLDDVAYLPDSVYEDAEKRAGLSRNRMLAQDPYAAENAALMRQMAVENYRTQGAIQRDSAKQQGTLGTLDEIEGEARQMIAEIQGETQDPSLRTPEQKAAAIERVNAWLESRQAALGVRQRLDGGF